MGKFKKIFKAVAGGVLGMGSTPKVTQVDPKAAADKAANEAASAANQAFIARNKARRRSALSTGNPLGVDETLGVSALRQAAGKSQLGG